MITASVSYGDYFAFHVDAEESASVWTCTCDSNGFPQVAADGHSPNCFKACNCTWGTFPLSLPLVLNFHLLNFTCSFLGTFNTIFPQQLTSYFKIGFVSQFFPISIIFWSS